MSIKQRVKLTFDNLAPIFELARNTQGNVKTGGIIPFLTGGPGLGKSAVVKQYAASTNYLLVTIILSRSTGVDFGYYVPNKETGELDYYSSGRLAGRVPNAEDYDGVIVFFDELPSSLEETQVILLSLFEDRAWEDKPVADNVLYICAGNDPDSNCGASKLIEPLQSRLCEVPVEACEDGWVLHAKANNFYPALIAWHQWTNFSFFSEFDPNSDLPNLSPRDSEKFSDVLWLDPDEATKRIVGDGYLGTHATSSYLEFESFTREVQRPTEIIADPFGASTYVDSYGEQVQYDRGVEATDSTSYAAQRNRELGHLHAVLFNCVRWVSKQGESLQPEQAGALIKYFGRLPEVQAVLAFTACVEANELFAQCNEFSEFKADHQGL